MGRLLIRPGLRGLVPRHWHLRYRGFDPSGQPIDRTVEGFHARELQHETDHLPGVLYPMRMRDMRHFGFVETLAQQLTQTPAEVQASSGHGR